MVGATGLVREHVEAALKAADENSIPHDTVARAMMSLAIEIFLKERSPEDVKSELEYMISNVVTDEDQEFMRP